MDTISSSFLSKFPQSRSLPSNGSTKEKTKPHYARITSHSLFSTFPLKKLIPHEKLTLKMPLTKTSKENIIATFFKSIDDFICAFIDSPLTPSVDPNHVLSGNFYPVDELPPTTCEVVEGSLPPCLLGGSYIRNGPNPQFAPCGPHHLFDGDGMLHMIHIVSPDQVTFCSRYVSTYKYTVERRMGHVIFPSVFSSFNGLPATIARGLLSVARLLTSQFDPVKNGFGLANTSVALIAGRLYALGESDLPYALEVTSDGDITTLGRHDFFSEKPFLSMTAHPKTDSKTGETFAFRYHVIPPFFTLFKIDKNGKKQPDLPIFSMKSTSLAHDLAVTENYVVFPDMQIVIDLREIAKGRPPARFDSAKVPRLGIISRNAEDESELVWIEAPGLNMMHCFNAWEEDNGAIVMVVSNPAAIDQALERLDLAAPRLEKVVVDVKEKTLLRYSLSDEVLDMAAINLSYAGKKSRFVYAGIVAQPMMLVGVVKIDLWANQTVGRRLFGPDCSGSEPFFVAREPNNPAAEEDDGYLVSYIHDEKTNESKFLVMDAKSPTLETVAVVNLPARVPTGFHGLFVRESDLKK